MQALPSAGAPKQIDNRRVEAFLEMLLAERGVAVNTVDAYARDLRDFAGFLQSRDATLERADSADVRAYLARLEAHGLSPRTGARRLSTLRQFYRFLFVDGGRRDDPTTVIDSPRQTRSLPKVLSEVEVSRLLDAARQRPGPEGARLRALVELLYGTGLRVSELVGLPLAAVARDPEVIIVRGKGGKERLVPLGEPARSALRGYLPERQHFLCKGGEQPWLFPGRGGHLSRHRFAQLLKGLARAAGLPPQRLSPHGAAACVCEPSAGQRCGRCAASSRCWDTPTSPPPRSIPMSRRNGYAGWSIAITRWPGGSAAVRIGEYRNDWTHLAWGCSGGEERCLL